MGSRGPQPNPDTAVPLSLKMSIDLFAALTAQAAAENITRADLMRALLREGLHVRQVSGPYEQGDLLNSSEGGSSAA